MTAEARRKAAEGGITPLDYMLTVMRDEAADTSRRDQMALAAAPYLHPKPAPYLPLWEAKSFGQPIDGIARLAELLRRKFDASEAEEERSTRELEAEAIDACAAEPARAQPS